MTGGLVIGPLYDLGFVRSLLVAGTVLVTFGFMMTSISTQYYQVLLAQGICVGLGTSCLYIPAITLVPAYFTSHRARAMGVAAVGSSVGAAIYPLIFERLRPQIGFGWTVRVIGFVSLALCCYAIAVARPKAKTAKGTGAINQGQASFRALVTMAKLKDTRYIVQCIAIFFSNVAFFEPLYYLQTYAQSHGMRGDNLANYLLVVLNLVAIPGRLIPSYAADRVGVLNTYIGITAFTSASVFYWISVTNRAGNIAFTVLYGFFSGGLLTLAPVVLTSITDDLSILGTRLGVVAVLKGIGSLIGPPIAGAILGSDKHWLGVQLFTGITLALTTAFAMLLRVIIQQHNNAKAQENVARGDERDEAVKEEHHS